MGNLTDQSLANGPMPPAVSRPRLDSIDLLRGLVMVIMALGWSVDRFIFSTLEKRLRLQRGMSV